MRKRRQIRPDIRNQLLCFPLSSGVDLSTEYDHIRCMLGRGNRPTFLSSAEIVFDEAWREVKANLAKEIE